MGNQTCSSTKPCDTEQPIIADPILNMFYPMFTVQKFEIPDIKLVIPKKFEDDRGSLSMTVHEKAFSDYGLPHFVQENQTFSRQAGTIRGLHFQKQPHAQAKLVRVLQGRIFDVALDIRPDSPSYGRFVTTTLSDKDLTQFYIPEGFAHGFCTLTDNTVVLYKMSALYEPSYERGILYSDPDLGISWPISADRAMLSDKDKHWPRLRELGMRS